MNLSKRISLIEKNFTKRDINFFRKDFMWFKDLISDLRQNHPKATILNCIRAYNKLLDKLILDTITRPSQVYRYIALESLLNSRDYNSIISELNSKIDFNDINNDIEFTGNLQNDYMALVKTFFHSEFVLKRKGCEDYLKKYPYNNKLKQMLRDLDDQISKINSGKLTAYDINKIQKKEKDFFQDLSRAMKKDITSDLAKNISSKIEYLRETGSLSDYENEYNFTLDKLNMPSSFRVKDKSSFEHDLLDENKLENYAISELVALNAFWTNRLVKEVERRNEVIYVLQNLNNFSAFDEGNSFNISDEDIIYYLAEYRAIVPYITKFKQKGRNMGKEKIVNEEGNMAVLVFDIEETFEKEDIERYKNLESMAGDVLKLNNRSQLLYDQKDNAIHEMIAFMLNTKEYYNAGISFENDGKRNTTKPMIVVDLKGYNAPLMLHIDKEDLRRSVKKISGKDDFTVYRGGKDVIIRSSQQGDYVAKTNLLFKLNSEQRKDIAARASLAGPKDTNAKYVTHISWMLNPKKDMPELIREPRRIIDLETGKITDVVEEQERKR